MTRQADTGTQGKCIAISPMRTPRRAVTLLEETKEGFLEVKALKDEGTPGREYREKRPEDRWSEMAGRVRHLREAWGMTQTQVVKALDTRLRPEEHIEVGEQEGKIPYTVL